MNGKPGEGARIQSEFSSRRRRQLLATLLMLPVVAVIGTADEARGTALGGVPLAAALPVGVVMFLALIGFSIRNWRCPACDRYLGRGFNPSYCPRCGVALQ